jgi:actin-like ATPase involved in cell morphogenesis
MSGSAGGWVLSIDFGTSFTAAAMGYGDAIDVVEIDNLPRMSSAVFWKAAENGNPGRVVIGGEAERQAVLAPDRFERAPKRRLGDEFMLLGGEWIRVTDAIGAIMRRVADEATVRRGGVIPREVRLTHPARWGAPRLQKLAQAASAAGLGAPVFVPEPVGAAMFFARAQLHPGDHVAVYDLGGGTFDTAVLKRVEHGFEVVGEPGGRDDLGGEDFDERLYQYLGAQLDPEQWQTLISPEAERPWKRANHGFREEVTRAKERLSTEPDATVIVPFPVDRDLKVSASDVNGLIRADIESTVEELGRTIKDAGLSVADLSVIYLAGGSSRIPLVSELINEKLGKRPSTFGDPKAAIALGASNANVQTARVAPAGAGDRGGAGSAGAGAGGGAASGAAAGAAGGAAAGAGGAGGGADAGEGGSTGGAGGGSNGAGKQGATDHRPVIALAVIALIGVLVGGLAAAGVFSSGGSSPPPVVSTDTSSIDTSTTGTSNTGTTSTGTSSTAPPVPAGAVASCGGNLFVGPNTSCPFAQNVQQAYSQSGGGNTNVTAFSPATGQTYTMSCTAGSGSTATVCTGGDNASVYFY